MTPTLDQKARQELRALLGFGGLLWAASESVARMDAIARLHALEAAVRDYADARKWVHASRGKPDHKAALANRKRARTAMLAKVTVPSMPTVDRRESCGNCRAWCEAGTVVRVHVPWSAVTPKWCSECVARGRAAGVRVVQPKGNER